MITPLMLKGFHEELFESIATIDYFSCRLFHQLVEILQHMQRLTTGALALTYYCNFDMRDNSEMQG